MVLELGTASALADTADFAEGAEVAIARVFRHVGLGSFSTEAANSAARPLPLRPES
jgi:predicted nicotinamide N-methyase